MSEQNQSWSHAYAWGSTLPTSLSFSTGGGVSYGYDGSNRVNAAWRSDSFGTVYTSRTHDGRGALLSETTQVGQHESQTEFVYDVQGRLSGLVASAGGLEPLTLSMVWSGARLTGLEATRPNFLSTLSTVSTALDYDGALLVESAQRLGSSEWLGAVTRYDHAGRAVERTWSQYVDGDTVGLGDWCLVALLRQTMHLHRLRRNRPPHPRRSAATPPVCRPNPPWR